MRSPARGAPYNKEGKGVHIQGEEEASIILLALGDLVAQIEAKEARGFDLNIIKNIINDFLTQTESEYLKELSSEILEEIKGIERILEKIEEIKTKDSEFVKREEIVNELIYLIEKHPDLHDRVRRGEEIIDFSWDTKKLNETARKIRKQYEK